MTHQENQLSFVTDLVSITGIQNVVVQIIEAMPIQMKEPAQKVNIIVENYADTKTLEGLKITNKYELLGLYRGTPLPVKKFFEMAPSTDDHIFLYRCPLIRYSHENKQSIEYLVQQVLFHELGHHFGCSRSSKF